jgi:cephalosporin hydroxylase
MKLTLDTDARTLTLEKNSASQELPLYSREAFELLSREWVRIGWSLYQYFTFSWFGRPILQLPEDLVRIQEVIAKLRPDVIVETGIYQGGSLLFHATLCEGLGNGRVIGIDQHISEDTRSSVSAHRLSKNIEMIEADSAAPATLERVRSAIRPNEKVLVILDSDHSKNHVARELANYAPLVTPGSYIVVTDGITRDLADVPNGDPSWVLDNPCAAAAEFLAEHPEFVSQQPEWIPNRSPLRQNITYWPEGWLRRKY